MEVASLHEPIPEDLSALWERVRGDLRASLPPSTFKLWLEPLQPLSAQDRTLYVSAPDSVRAWVERRYERVLGEALARHTGEATEIVLVAPGPAAPAAADSQPVEDPAGSFDDFVIGSGNRFAHAAALAVAEMPAEAYNPLFLHGAPGLGKTHLLWAIGNYVTRYGSGLRVRYATVEDFTSAFVEAVRFDRTAAFKDAFRRVDVVLIDD